MNTPPVPGVQESCAPGVWCSFTHLILASEGRRGCCQFLFYKQCCVLIVHALLGGWPMWALFKAPAEADNQGGSGLGAPCLRFCCPHLFLTGPGTDTPGARVTTHSPLRQDTGEAALTWSHSSEAQLPLLCCRDWGGRVRGEFGERGEAVCTDSISLYH